MKRRSSKSSVMFFYKVAADLVLLFHFVFVILAVAGGFFSLIDGRWLWIHIPVVVWSSAVNLASWTCPLTPLEKLFREKAGGIAYKEDFIQYYVGRLVYPKGMPRKMEIMAGVSVLVWNVIVYAGIWLFIVA